MPKLSLNYDHYNKIVLEPMQFFTQSINVYNGVID